MKAWTEWETTRRQVAIGGRVLDAGDQPIAGAEVTVSVADQRSWQCLAKADGIYYFLDLPAGTHTIKSVDGRSGAALEKAVSVSWSKDGKVKMVMADLKLSRVGAR